MLKQQLVCTIGVEDGVLLYHRQQQQQQQQH